MFLIGFKENDTPAFHCDIGIKYFLGAYEMELLLQKEYNRFLADEFLKWVMINADGFQKKSRNLSIQLLNSDGKFVKHGVCIDCIPVMYMAMTIKGDKEIVVDMKFSEVEVYTTGRDIKKEVESVVYKKIKLLS